MPPPHHDWREFPSAPVYSIAARRFVAEAAGDLGFAESAVADIELAVGEAFTNAMRHGSPAGPDDYIRIAYVFESESATFRIEVRDCGGGFDPQAVPLPDTQALREGGMGIFFMRTVMDDVRYLDRGTTVQMVKRLG